MQRKQQHIQYALTSPSIYNSFDDVELLHTSLPTLALNEIDISTEFAGYRLSCPFFINAMTGGNFQQAIEINKNLAILAQACDLLMFTGSYSPALADDPQQQASFDIIRQTAPNILLGTNIGMDKNWQAAQQAVTALKADLLQIHLNTLQELLMPEGEKNFKSWQQNLIDMQAQLSIPIIVKETGFGMSYECMQRLIKLGVKYIDIGGKGGTNFAYIENQRRDNALSYMNDWGITTVASLLEAKRLMQQADIIASGGIRQPLDIIKALVLGAKAVGIAGILLKHLHQYGLAETIQQVKAWQDECRLIMCLLNCQNLNTLTQVQYILKGDSLNHYQQRVGSVG